MNNFFKNLFNRKELYWYSAIVVSEAFRDGQLLVSWECLYLVKAENYSIAESKFYKVAEADCQRTNQISEKNVWSVASVRDIREIGDNLKLKDGYSFTLNL